jgi:omega-6 fatty acid desaturase (delta-12 desaturase)
LTFFEKFWNDAAGRVAVENNQKTSLLFSPSSRSLQAGLMVQTQSLHARTKPYARDSSWKSWWCIFSAIFLVSAAFAGTFPIMPIPVRILCSGLAGLLLVRLFVIYHDHQHHAILPKSRSAAILMRILGIFLICPNAIWRSSHDYHHTHNCKLRSAHIGSFPIMTREQYRQTPTGGRLLYLSMRHPLTILFGYISVFILGMLILPFFRSPGRYIDSIPALLLHVAIAAWLAVHFGWLALVLTMILPFFIACALGSYLFYAQHNFPGVILKDKGGWTFEGAALELFENKSNHGMVHRKHWLSPHPSPESSGAVLPPPRGLPRHPRTASGSNNVSSSAGNFALPPIEGLVRGDSAHDGCPGALMLSLSFGHCPAGSLYYELSPERGCLPSVALAKDGVEDPRKLSGQHVAGRRLGN